MFSKQTCIELASLLERTAQKDLDRLFHVFELSHHVHEFSPNRNNSDKANVLLKLLLNPPLTGAFTDNFQIDILQYKVDQFYRYEQDNLGLKKHWIGQAPPFEILFELEHKSLCHYLKRDGYIIRAREIRKLLPQEMEEAKIESELMRLLNIFSFNLSKQHLILGQRSLNDKNWSGSNAQMRNFIESLLISICQKLLPTNECKSPSQAIKLLGNTITPAFLQAELNEIAHGDFKHPFVESLWKRLHPHGSHPGLSNENDAMFRFQITVAFGYYLLNRLDERVN